jgi:hypothetical protein
MRRRRAGSLLAVILFGLLVSGPAWGAAGDLSWEKQLTFLPQYDNIIISGLALASTTYIVSGTAVHSDATPGSMGFIKAFDVNTGNIKWEKTLTLGDTGNSFGTIAINGDIALVRGIYSSGIPNPTLLKTFIRAYNADSGELFWEVILDFEVIPPNTTPQTPSLIMGNNRAFSVFTPYTSNGFHHTISVRAYQLRNITPPMLLLLDN